MAQTTVIGGQPTRNNGACVLNGNSQDTSRVSENLTLATSAKFTHQNGLPVVSSANGTAKAVSAGTFAETEAGNYIIIGVSANLGGVATTAFNSSKKDVYSRGYHKLEGQKTGWLKTLTIDSTNGVSYTQSAKTLSFGTDNATLKRLTYMDGSPNPTSETL